MTTTHAERRSLRRVLDAIPADLILVIAFAIVVDALVLASVGWEPIRFVLGMILLFFIPGYALVAALFPGQPHRPVEGRERRPNIRDPHDGLVLKERLAVSFGASIALVPVLAVVLGALSFPLTAENVLASVTLVIFAFAAIGAIRRARLRPDHRYLPLGRHPTRGDGGRTVRQSSRRSTVLAVGLVVAVALAGGVFVYGIAAEPPSSEYTNAMLLTETDDGSYVASGYPTNATEGEPVSLTLRIDNRRSSSTSVSAAVVLERPGEGGAVVQGDRLATLENELPADGRWNATHAVTPTFAGEDLRLAYYVYEGDLPASVGPESADHELYLRIDVNSNGPDA